MFCFNFILFVYCQKYLVKFLGNQMLNHSDKTAIRLVNFFCQSVWIFRQYLGVLRGCSSSIMPLQYPYWDPLAEEANWENYWSIAPVAIMDSTNSTHLRIWLIWVPLCLGDLINEFDHLGFWQLMPIFWLCPIPQILTSDIAACIPAIDI